MPSLEELENDESVATFVVGNKIAIMDKEDLPLIKDWSRPTIHIPNKQKPNNAYVRLERTLNKKKERKYLHHHVLNLCGDEMVDHINRDGLDNRKSNLRICDKSKNAANSISKEKQSLLPRGVTKVKSGYTARITVEGNTIYLGSFSSELLAGLAYEEARVKYFGEFAPKE